MSPTKPPRWCPRCHVPHAGACPRRVAEQVQQDRDRGSASARGYDAKWRIIRAAFLKAHPRCVRCGQASEEAHHVRRVRDGGGHEWGNLMALCKPCHSAVTIAEDRA